jgi:hypothetical protein
MWTHLSGFDQLTSYELDALVDAPVLITVLVGAADGDLDREERTWSERLMQARTYSKPRHLNEYYTVVAHNFLAKLDAALERLPFEAADRNAVISKELEHLNPILAKIDQLLAADLYKSYLGLAKETARASGGFLRIGAISPEEAEWIKLPMLTAIAPPPKGSVSAEPDDWEEEQD